MTDNDLRVYEICHNCYTSIGLALGKTRIDGILDSAKRSYEAIVEPEGYQDRAYENAIKELSAVIETLRAARRTIDNGA